MKVEVKIQSNCSKPYAVIYTDEITAEVQRILDYIKDNTNTIIGTVDERIYVLTRQDIFMVAVENERIYLYTKNGKFVSKKRLYEIKTELGSDFVQISKSVLVKVAACASVESVFGGMMLLHLKNGHKEYVSRHYLSEFKKSLGL